MVKKKFSVIILFIVLLLHLAFTFFSSDVYEGSIATEIDSDKSAIWNHLINVKELHLTRKELDTVEVIKKYPGGMQHWKELYKNGDLEEFKHISFEKENKLVFETVRSDKGLIGKWELEILPMEDNLTDEKKCILKINETSTANTFFYKWIHTLIGREAKMKKITETLKYQLEKAGKKEKN